jgi:hypothetical protein
MTRKAVSSRTGHQRLRTQYLAAVAEYNRITRYLKAGVSILSQAERDLLSEFAELAKRRYERLRRRFAAKEGKARAHLLAVVGKT